MASAWETDTEHISIVKARAMLTQLPELLAEENRAVALTRRGKPVLALMPWELFQSVIETLEIMGDAEMMDALRRGIRDAQEGNLVSLDEVKVKLGIND
ncbi:MAG: type II toxin-antitoxin system Phd/YefM family antitoxin [Chloroflexota bacterium]|nr:type II toxin-antitoxin system Phd/YefM family antitoxin [Chloroflexota bacterium]MDE2961411.1 type II toxin-antitoxin system Phd/YefM family antitoxin [Chloroflexota bacterium]